jgi:ABC-type polar amino acid transport system ATPase subunit
LTSPLRPDPEYPPSAGRRRRLRREGLNFIIVTHEWLCATACEKTRFLTGGRIAESGPSRNFRGTKIEELRGFEKTLS